MLHILLLIFVIVIESIYQINNILYFISHQYLLKLCDIYIYVTSYIYILLYTTKCTEMHRYYVVYRHTPDRPTAHTPDRPARPNEQAKHNPTATHRSPHHRTAAARRRGAGGWSVEELPPWSQGRQLAKGLNRPPGSVCWKTRNRLALRASQLTPLGVLKNLKTRAKTT